jgi:hypothetical protein
MFHLFKTPSTLKQRFQPFAFCALLFIAFLLLILIIEPGKSESCHHPASDKTDHGKEQSRRNYKIGVG